MVRFAVAALALVTCLLGQADGGSQILLLDFSSPTCGPCRQMDPLIHSFEQAGYPIRKVDTSQEPHMARDYNITRVPCFVMLVDGREIHRTIGTIDSNQLQQMFQQAREVVIAEQRRNQAPSQSPRSPEPVAMRDESPSPAGSQPAGSLPAAENSNVEALLKSTVRLRVDDGKFRSFGTGTIVDAREGEALIVTCGHLFRDSKGKSPVQVETFEVADGRVKAAGQISGWVLNYDLDRDIALVVIRPARPVTVAPIAPPGSTIERGDRVVSIGCSNGNDPTAQPTRITMLDRYQGPPNIEAAGAPVEGRSGGGLFNDKGQLIGICNSADYEGNEGLYTALQSIHDEVARLNLLSAPDQLAANGSNSPRGSMQNGLVPVDTIVRGQDNPPSDAASQNRDPITPIGATTIGPAGRLPDKPEGLSTAEQAAWDEIAKRAAESEVIIIVRPKEAGGQSEVITLDNVSPEFVRAIAGRQRDAQAPVTR